MATLCIQGYVGLLWQLITLAQNLQYRGVCVQALSEVCAVCNDAHIEYKEGRYHAVGAPTEAALVVLVEKLGVADAGLNSRIQQQRAATPEGHADGTCQAYCRRSEH